MGVSVESNYKLLSTTHKAFYKAAKNKKTSTPQHACSLESYKNNNG